MGWDDVELSPELDENGEVMAECHPQAAFRSILDIVKIFIGGDLDELENLREEEIQAILIGALSQDEIWR